MVDIDAVAGLEREKPLTPAEKQKAYRERHGDTAREANRLRMAAKRRIQEID